MPNYRVSLLFQSHLNLFIYEDKVNSSHPWHVLKTVPAMPFCGTVISSAQN